MDKPRLMEQFLLIDNKDRIIVPFKPNNVQQLFADKKGKRNIIIKARQLGMSSYILADMFLEAITVPNTICIVVSHEGHATQRLLDKIHFFYGMMEEPKPRTGAESRTEITFPELHSSIYVGTAHSMTFGRGDRIDRAHLSELAFYEDGERIVNAIEEAVPLTGSITAETSPNGEDNYAYEMWAKAREGKNSYKPFFLPWWLGKDYRLPPNHELALVEDRGELTYSGEEIDLIERFGLSEEQIRWRRYKIANKGGLFYQEYPEDEVSCFLTIGDPVFDQFILTALAQGSYEGEHHSQGWTFWIPPQEKMNYVIGVDTSAGVPGGSYSAAVVLDDQWQVCATFQARVEPYILAAILKEMGKWYNKAEIAVERNFTGYAVLGHMQDYSNIYMQRDFVTGKITTQRGWWTSEATKQYMITVTKDMLPRLKLWDINLVRQLRGYRYIKFRPSAQTFDDLAIALMISCAVRKVAGVAKGYQGAVKDWNW